MIHGIKKKKIRENRTSKALIALPDFIYNISEGLNDKFTKLTVSSIKDFSVVIHNKLAFLNLVRKREKTLWGQIINRLNFEDPHHVDLNGVELKTLLNLTGETADIYIDYVSKQLYSVPYSEVNSMYEKLQEVIEIKEGDLYLE